MIRWLILLIWGQHDCAKHGHAYFARYDDINDPRLDGGQLKNIISSPQYGRASYTRVRIYVRDICRYCGDVIERIEGLNALEVLAHQAKRIS